ncbi:carbon-nitrogen hydrolase family protein [candidate division KSB3 bacterium]|uniref:Carbon-nitrogen hydrolase family protein n=1 Tax=candidate division KSB3 bacterium TaxID=2044937 RepID=A0A9D5Q605_9BACT|nr:carbon-nitrogen hydrolase family protein [candidate division KSB3 bacterium]MBD3325185.1 carbon-nitrogen hydrolase family protein [candidate division KSB3 bacterium]
MFTLAMIQMRVEGGQKARNLTHAVELIAEAAASGAALALLPEALDVGWTHPSATTEAEPIPDGESCRVLREAAKRHALYVCAGLTENADGQIFNAAVIINPDGEVILHHRKLNELDIGHASYAQGDRLNVCHTELGTLGLMICADGFAQDEVLSRSLGYMGADLILSPCAWAVPADHDQAADPYGELWRRVYMPVARAFSMYIVGVSNVGWISGGPWEGRKCICCSLAIGPQGEELLQGPYGVDAEAVLTVDIAPVARPARGDQWAAYWQQNSNQG